MAHRSPMCPALVLWLAVLLISPSLTLTALAQGGDRTLHVGDVLAPLHVQEWLRGEPVTTWQPDHVYLVDLWATWCTPCLAGMAHLDALQKRFADDGLVVIGITSQDSWGNDLATVRQLLAKRAHEVTYRMAWVAPSRSSSGDLQGIFVHEWMRGLGTKSLPMAFLLDGQGRLVWAGNPHLADPVVEKLVSGGLDMATARSELDRAHAAAALRSRGHEALQRRDWDAAASAARSLLEEYADVSDPKLLTGFAVEIADTDGKIPPMLLDVALRLADQAVIATRFAAPGHLDGLATVLAAHGDRVAAALAEMRAVSVSEGEMRSKQQEKLERYLEAAGVQSR